MEEEARGAAGRGVLPLLWASLASVPVGSPGSGAAASAGALGWAGLGRSSSTTSEADLRGGTSGVPQAMQVACAGVGHLRAFAMAHGFAGAKADHPRRPTW